MSHVPKLPHAPLQEVVFELHWKLETDSQSGLLFDKQFVFARGIFQNLVKDTYPILEPLTPGNVPEMLFSTKPILRFWSKDKTFPVVQLGHGILTVNDTDTNYFWDDFKHRIIDSLKWLHESYKEGLDFNYVELRYIDCYALSDSESSNFPEFLNENLNISIQNKIELPKSKLAGLKLTQKYKLDDNNYLNLTFNNGKRNSDESNVVIWQSSVYHQGDIADNSLEEWIDQSHDLCSNLFKNTVNAKLYEQFK